MFSKGSDMTTVGNIPISKETRHRNRFCSQKANIETRHAGLKYSVTKATFSSIFQHIHMLRPQEIELVTRIKFKNELHTGNEHVMSEP